MDKTNKNKNTTSTLSQLIILQWNCHSMNNFSELKNHLADIKIKPHFICLQETFLTSNKKIPKFQGYKVASFKHRTTAKTKGGGVLIYHMENIPVSELEIKIDPSDFEFCASSIYLNKETITLLNCYDPPGSDTRDSYIQLLDRIPTQNYILVGDFNAHHKLWSSTNNTRGKHLEKLLTDNLLVVLNGGEATMATSPTSPDLTLATPAICVGTEWQPLENSCGSDHLPVITTFRMEYNSTGTASQGKWKLIGADWDRFKQLCSDTLKIVESTNINKVSEGFTEMLRDICKKTIPKTKPKPSKIRPPWWDIEITNMVRQREQARKKYLNKRTDDLKQTFNSLKTDTRNLIRDKQVAKWRDFVSKLDHKATSKQVWNMVNRFRGKPFDHITCLKSGNAVITDDREKANVLAQHYDSMSKTKNQNGTFVQIKKHIEEDCNLPQKLLDKGGDNDSNLNRPFSLFELNNALASKHNSSPGADTIHYEMLKQLPDKSKQLLLTIMNTSWEKGEVPTDWKLATIIPIKKPNKDKLDPASYRPISLTSCICKTMETMVAKRLTSHLENGNHLADSQSGFRKGRSTLDQLTRLETEINYAFMERKVVAAVFLDLEKAFDLMWSTGTIMQLSKFGIDGRMLKWIHNFLANRKIQVRVGNETSDQHTLENGCPQGSVISPILFNAIINTLNDHLKKHKDIGLSQYADDGAIWNKSSSPEQAVKALQKALIDIEGWATFWGFKISSTKTEAIIFRRRLKLKLDHLNLKLFGKTINFVNKVKFLGMIFDRFLTWRDHINDLVEKCKQDMNVLRLVSGTSFGADKKTLVNLYKALILSKIDYGCQAYNSALPSCLKSLDLIQNQAMRIATRAVRSTPINALEVECGLKPLSLRREELILKYWARSSPLGDSLPVNKLISKHGFFLTKRAKQYWPYARTVLELLDKYDIPHHIEPPSFRKKCDLSHIPPSSKVKEQIGIKGESTIETMKTISLAHIEHKHRNKLHVFTDGSKDPDQQSTGAAFVIPSLDIKRGFKCDSILSVFTTELIAIEHAIKWIKKNKVPESVIFSDSLSSVQALHAGQSRTRLDKVDRILNLLDNAKSKGISIQIEWIPSHIGIDGNELADLTAKNAMLDGFKDKTKPAKSEIYSVINKTIISKWQQQWDHPPSGIYKGRAYYHLQRNVKKDVVMYSSNRLHDKVYTRLRFGHSRLGFHCRWEKEGICRQCDDQSFEDDHHVLFDCPAYADSRRDLEAAVFNLGFKQVTYDTLLSPPREHLHEVVRAVIEFLKNVGCLDRV